MSTAQQGRPVVVGVDGSEPAQRAVRWAAREAARRHVPLRVVTAFEWTHDHALGQVGLGASYREIMLGVSREQLADAALTAEQEQPGLVVRPQLVVGYPIPVLTAEARGAQLVVIGDRGLGGVTGPSRSSCRSWCGRSDPVWRSRRIRPPAATTSWSSRRRSGRARSW